MFKKILYIWSKFFKKIQSKSILNSKIHSTSKVEAGSSIINSSFEKHSFCGYNCQIINTDIGAFCSIADKVIIGPTHHPFDWVSTSPVFYEGTDSVKAKFAEFSRQDHKRTYIGNDVWVGINVIIKSGVKIGDGAIIGMGSIVTKDVEPYSIVAGVPAKLIRMRFEEDIIKKLKKIKWWNLDENILMDYSKEIKDPKKFVELFNK